MAVYLNEKEFGSANDKVAFPHLLLCMGFVALTGNAMFGMHSDTRQDSGELAHELYGFMAGRGVNGGNIVALYGCGNWSVRYGFGNNLAAWKEEMRQVALAFGFNGPARGFDTSIIAPQDGTYVEYLPLYAQQRSRILYKRNEKMVYQNTSHYNGPPVNPDIKKFHAYGAIVNVTYETTGGNVIQTSGNQGNLHEVDYNARLMSFNI
jgi:hypothetical protein